MKSINLITDLLVYFDNLTIQKLTLEPQKQPTKAPVSN